MVEIPDVKYKSTEEATRILESAGLVVEVENVTGFPLPSQLAVGTRPPPGTSVPDGSTVVLLVA
ncbi:PASTA domain-containing protein [Tessaracoccus antarcticus]